MKTFLVLLMLAFTAPAFAQAPPNCGPTPQVLKMLQEQYHEKPMFMGTIQDEIRMTFWGNLDTGTFSIVMSTSQGSCIMAGGENLQEAIAPDPVPEGTPM